MADSGEVHAVEEMDCPRHSIGSERWSPWLEVTPVDVYMEAHEGAAAAQGGGSLGTAAQSAVVGRARVERARLGVVRKKTTSGLFDGVL
jgi:hypothetical protein